MKVRVPYMPEFLIRKLITSNVPLNPESEYYEATKFMLEQLDGLDRDDLISRIQLYCKLGPLNPEDLPLNNEAITIIDVLFITFHFTKIIYDYYFI